jgi:hypothetical protein
MLIGGVIVTSSFTAGSFDQQETVCQSMRGPEHPEDENFQKTESALLSGQQAIANTSAATTCICIE